MRVSVQSRLFVVANFSHHTFEGRGWERLRSRLPIKMELNDERVGEPISPRVDNTEVGLKVRPQKAGDKL